MKFHWHRDPGYQLVGANAYYECRCGARRVRHVIHGLMSPVAGDWPNLKDRHGYPVSDTGWVKP